MDLKFFRKEEPQSLKPSRRIVIASGCRGCGVSFITAFLADGLKRLGTVSISEPGRPYFYNALSMEKKFLYRGFDPFYEKIRRAEKINGVNNTEDGINWYLRKGDDFEPLSAAELFRSYHIPGEDHCLYDCSGLDEDNSLALLLEADRPVIVVDPGPVKLFESRNFIEKALLKLTDPVIIVNRMNDGVYIRELNRFLGSRNYFSMVSVPAEYTYKAEYAGIGIMEIKKVSEELSETQDILLGLFK